MVIGVATESDSFGPLRDEALTTSERFARDAKIVL
jgi:hypothetical protein